MKYKLDNEFELVFVVGFQKILTLTYVDKFLDDVQLRFRDRYKNQLEQKGAMKLLNGSFQFQDDFQQLLREAEESTKACAPAPMKTFMQSQKSQKTVKSMIETRGGEKGKEKESNKKSKNAKKEGECQCLICCNQGRGQFLIFNSYSFLKIHSQFQLQFLRRNWN
ncbi:Signal recognition particle receptor subunit alpha [Acipenser ruthenus]|uniref:Signal recognition particle receptor subunit alpha n=1 Tax=Acipenser ruthenus TaxID=7906 RepID=A0A444UR25_ACIRT|nr:Signal recognition particle receptor subunit alpha [Acipenser ruthenus]